jgi:hypothetical protein
LACAWPVLIGLRTIARLRTADVMQLRGRVKVPRHEVYGILLRSTLASPVPWWWRKLYCPPLKAVASGGKLA